MIQRIFRNHGRHLLRKIFAGLTALICACAVGAAAKPGGGDCVVAYYVDATGRVGAISGFLKLGTLTDGEFVSDEKAVEMDLPMTDEEVKEVFFYADRIAEYIAGHME